MSMRTVDWTPPRTPGAGAAEAEGLRERKKRLMRQQLSDTATQMFMERGFDAVRVTEIAEACGVSEKTVFNYFPTKESLILDRLESTMASLKTGLTQPGAEPAEPALRHPDPGLTITAGPSKRHDGPVRRSGRRDPRRAGRHEPGRPRAANRGHRLARPVAHSVPGPVEIPERHPDPRTGPPGRERRRQPRRPAHRHRTAIVPIRPA